MKQMLPKGGALCQEVQPCNPPAPPMSTVAAPTSVKGPMVISALAMSSAVAPTPAVGKQPLQFLQ